MIKNNSIKKVNNINRNLITIDTIMQKNKKKKTIELLIIKKI